MRIRFFRLSRPSSFEYKPLYYKPEEEELAQRVKRAETDVYYTKTDDGKVQRNEFGFKRSFQSESKSSNRRLVLIIAGLVIVTYWLMKGFWGEIVNMVF